MSARGTGAPAARGRGGTPEVRLVRRAVPPVETPALDEDQRRVVEHRDGPLLVLAGPGTGKTTTLVETVVDRVHGGLDPERVLVLTYGRRAAEALRTRISRRLGRTTREPVARTFHSYAFGLLRREALAQGEPPPRLLTGAEQDVVIRELLAGDVTDGRARWPRSLHPALPTAGFAEEVRDVLLRMVERGVSPAQLQAWGQRHGRADWTALASFARTYEGVTALQRPAALDPAELVRAAVALLQDDPALLAAEREARALVVVDEYQDSDPAQEALLHLLSGGGRDLVVVGDPDQSIYGFRGSEPANVEAFPQRFRTADGRAATVVALGRSRRSGPTLTAASRAVAARLGGAPGHRQLSVVGADEPVDPAGAPFRVEVFGGTSQQAAFVATQLRTAHVVHGVRWERMAVLVRSATAVPALRRALGAADVPVRVGRADLPLVDHPAARALLTLLDVAVGDRVLDADTVFALLAGPLFEVDALALRRLRQALREAELRSGGGRPSAELVVAAVTDERELLLVDADAVDPVRSLGEALGAAARQVDQGATAEDVLWSVWSGLGLAGRWSTRALRGGSLGATADHDLDAVVALFDAAARFADRLPGAHAKLFAEHVRAQVLPSDTPVAAADDASGVAVLTAHAAKGLEWDVVVVAGVQEGVWPDLRARGSLLGVEEIVDLAAADGGGDGAPSGAAARVARQNARLAEERRLFYVAVTRARRQLVVTAVATEDEQPSRFLDDLDAAAGGSGGERPVSAAPRTLDLAAVVAELRSVLADPAGDAARRAAAALALARLAEQDVPFADPRQWYGVLPLSDPDPLVPGSDPVPVAPSKVEEFEQCGLRWLLRSAGADDGQGGAAGVGSLVHGVVDAAEQHGWDTAQMLAEVDARWAQVDVGSGWSARRQHERARSMIEVYGAWREQNPRELIGTEVDFTARLDRAELRGRVDRLERDAEGRLVVVDLKTGKAAAVDRDLPQHPQLLVYQLAVQAGGFAGQPGVAADATTGGASLVQVGTGRPTAKEQVQGRLDDDAVLTARERVEAVAEGMAAASFPTVTGAWCRSCPARSSCPAWPEGQGVTS